MSDDVAVLDGQRVTSAFGEVEIELIAATQARCGASNVPSSGSARDAPTAGRRSRARSEVARSRLRVRRATPIASGCISRSAMSICSPPIPASVSAPTPSRCTTCVSPCAACARCFARAGSCSCASGRTLREELDWLGRALGPLRDLDVLAEHLRAEGAELGEADRAASRSRARGARKRSAAARADALAALDSERYFTLLESLASPPQLADEGGTLEAAADAQLGKLRKNVRAAKANGSDELLHKSRIRAKRVRYLAEALGEKRVVDRAKDFQDVVGEHQDAVVAEERLRALAERVPEAALTLGVLIERQRERRLRTRGDLPRSWKRLRKSAEARLELSDETIRAAGAVVVRRRDGRAEVFSFTGRSTTTGRCRRERTSRRARRALRRARGRRGDGPRPDARPELDDATTCPREPEARSLLARRGGASGTRARRTRSTSWLARARGRSGRLSYERDRDVLQSRRSS